jgi:tetratricopeptide (TPR) repeat protein
VRPRHALLRASLSTVRRCGLVLLLAPACQPALAAGPACKIARLAELPVTMVGTTPIVHALINGADAPFIADSGAFFDMLTPAAAAEYKLPVKMAPWGLYITGVGGEQQPDIATVKEFTIFGLKIPNAVFLVAGNDLGPAVGLLGQNAFRIADTEYDLANGVIRIMRPGECKSVGLAYWAASGTYSEIDISRPTEREANIVGHAYLNGKKIVVLFDTGASTSVLSLEAAKRAGITPASEGVVPAPANGGIGQHYIRTWIAPFHSFKIGDEEIRDTKLRIGELSNLASEADMLLGADFFLSHRIFAAKSRGKLYFTYNGGPVFNLGAGSKAEQAQGESIAVASGQTLGSITRPTDAAAFSRQAMAASDRHDYASAVADLNHAVELAPTEPSYLYQRGIALSQIGESDRALADLDAALKLKPDHVPSLLARAFLRLESDRAAAIADMEAADRLLPKEAVERLELAHFYERADLLPAALVQYSKWIDSHERIDVRMPQALNSRCRTRALLGQELQAALADCNDAVKAQPKNPAFLDSRGMVYLRLGNYDKAIADYDAALAAQPKIAWSHYGRGIARTRKGLTAQGQADMAEATALAPKIAEIASSHGINP